MTKFETSKGKIIRCQSMTFGYLYDVEQGLLDDNLLEAVANGTDMSEDDIRALTRVEVNEIWEIVKKETYPELYNEDGTEKDIEDDLVEDKKKA
jgi:hypothetical protein